MESTPLSDAHKRFFQDEFEKECDYFCRFASVLLKGKGGKDAVDDLVQSACERALAAFSRFDFGRVDMFKAWFCQIMRRIQIDHVRKQRMRLRAGASEQTFEHDVLSGFFNGAPQASPLAQLLEIEARAHLPALFVDMPPDLVKVVDLFCQGFTHAQIADQTGISLRVVYGRLWRAGDHMRRRLDQVYTPGPP